MTEPKTGALRAPGAVLHYDVRGADSTCAAATLRTVLSES